MGPVEVIIQVALLHFVASTSPGPDIFLVLGNSIRDGSRAGIGAAAGIVTGVAIQIALCMSGLALVVAERPGLHRALLLAGAIWLIYLGLRGLASFAGGAESAERSPARTRGNPFRDGLLTNLLNIKALLFFFALFTYVMSPELALWVKLVCAVEMVSVQMITFSLIAVLAGSPGFRGALGRYQRWASRAMSLILILFGGLLVWGAWRG